MLNEWVANLSNFSRMMNLLHKDFDSGARNIIVTVRMD
jgi:hypothetical protein